MKEIDKRYWVCLLSKLPIYLVVEKVGEYG